ncbi:MAG: biotin/lipoyl-binding protein [Planctomycetaceae bacterium]|nr:biotin/lipoyl-binding protein [Planctomycetaceae bacterium]
MVRPLHADVAGRVLFLCLGISGLTLFDADRLPAQVSTPPAGVEPSHVVIEREPLLLKPPETYRVSLQLEPARKVELTANTDGVVRSILIPSGAEAREQAEIIRLDSRERLLELDRAKAAFQAAQIEQRAAGQGTGKELADARLQIAKVDLDLAQFRLDQTILRAPFGGVVQSVHVVEGQTVRAGQPLATLIDASVLAVQIPIDRNATKVGEPLELRVEGKVAPATLTQVLPLTPPFEPLRELFQSIATGVANVENKAGAWYPGQTVYASLVPRTPVTEVSNAAIANMTDGGRRVQVVREGFVRDVPIELLSAVGVDRTIVSGPFGAKDELIVRTSQELPDGTQVIARTELVPPAEQATPASRAPRRNTLPPAAQ